MLIKPALLVLWFALIITWINRHLQGEGWLLEIALPFAALLYALITTLIDYYLDEDEQKSSMNSLRAFFRQMLQFRLLALLYLSAAILSLFYTSVTVLPTKEIRDRRIELTAAGSVSSTVDVESRLEKAKNLHFWINPFATQYILEVSGFRTATISVPPLLGTRIVPDRDLTPLPTILYRIDPTGFQVLGTNGSFQLFRRTESGYLPLAEVRGNHAWFSGPRRAQSNDLRNEWRLELISRNYDPESRANMMLRWRNPRLLQPDPEITEGDVVCALVANIDNKVISAAVETIGRANYVDIPLGELPDDTTNTGDEPADTCRLLESGAG